MSISSTSFKTPMAYLFGSCFWSPTQLLPPSFISSKPKKSIYGSHTCGTRSSKARVTMSGQRVRTRIPGMESRRRERCLPAIISTTDGQNHASIIPSLLCSSSTSHMHGSQFSVIDERVDTTTWNIEPSSPVQN